MKLNLEVELTPEEMRRLFGLPDVAPVNDMLVDKLRDQVEKGMDGTLLRNMIQGMVKGGTQGLEAYQSLLGAVFRGARVRTSEGGEAARAGEARDARRGASTPEPAPVDSGTGPSGTRPSGSAPAEAADADAPPAQDANTGFGNT